MPTDSRSDQDLLYHRQLAREEIGLIDAEMERRSLRSLGVREIESSRLIKLSDLIDRFRAFSNKTDERFKRHKRYIVGFGADLRDVCPKPGQDPSLQTTHRRPPVRTAASRPDVEGAGAVGVAVE